MPCSWLDNVAGQDWYFKALDNVLMDLVTDEIFDAL